MITPEQVAEGRKFTEMIGKVEGDIESEKKHKAKQVAARKEKKDALKEQAKAKLSPEERKVLGV
jgi:hypothetical protein